ncbi:MAG: ribonuclease HIII [Kiritimatiellia bacterium]|nr:ribonuclease HIII [Lentisphaerota bacterium]
MPISVKPTSFTFALTEEQQVLLLHLLQQGNYRPVRVEHTQAAVDAENCRVALYRSGKCLVQGKGAADFVTFMLEPQVLGEARLGYEEQLQPAHYEPHMGVDESGKGDFFGPLVIAAAYADRDLVPRMQALGVRDSKRISSDRRLLDIATELRKLLHRHYTVVRVGPAAYNRLYAKMRSVNGILAWGHARALENLLELVPGCHRAISDQFGSRQQVQRALMAKGRNIELEQRHRAESDPAVAAASILARADFLSALKDMSEHHGVLLPKGASAATIERGGELVEKHAPSILLQTAKCHFRTTDQVLQRLNLTREVLGPDGRLQSQAMRQSFRGSRSPGSGLKQQQ